MGEEEEDLPENLAPKKRKLNAEFLLIGVKPPQVLLNPTNQENITLNVKRKVNFLEDDVDSDQSKKFKLDTSLNCNKKLLITNKCRSTKEKYIDDLKMESLGLKTSEHGNIFQLKLLMLYLWRAGHEKENNQNKYEKFRLATELPNAEKFDDVFFQYEDTNDNKWKLRLIQAKHKDPVKADGEISLKDLLTTDNDQPFGLQKYFHSYIKIVQRSKENNPYFVFYNNEIEDVVIITNASFVSREENNLFTSDVIEIKDDFLLRTYEQNARIFKLKVDENNSKINKLKLIFESTADFYQLTNALSTHILQSKKICKEGIFKEYFYPLSREFDVVEETKKYYVNFNKFLKKDSDEGANSVKQAVMKEIAFRKISVFLPEIDEKFGDIELPNESLVLKNLAIKVAEFITNKKMFTVNYFEEYHVALAQSVIDVKKKQEEFKAKDKEECGFYLKFIRVPVNPKNRKVRSKLVEFKKYLLDELKIQPKALENVRFNVSDDFGVSYLPSDENTLVKLAKYLANHIKNNKKLSVSDENLKSVHVGLAKEVITVEDRKFQDVFLNGEEKKEGKIKKLSPEAQKLRRELINELYNIGIITEDKKCLDKIEVSDGFKSKEDPKIEKAAKFALQIKVLILNSNQKIIEINNVKEKLKLNDGGVRVFSKNIKQLTEYVLINSFGKIRFSTAFLHLNNKNSSFLPESLGEFKNELIKLLGKEKFEMLHVYEFKIKDFKTCADGEVYRELPTPHNNQDVKDFFAKFKFIVKFPNRTEINTLLGEEIKSALKTLDDKVFQSRYYEHLHDWMANRVGKFYTADKANELFKEIQYDLLLWTIAGFNKPYFAECSHEYKFKEYNILKEFLSDHKQVLHLVCRELFLGRSRIVQTFQSLQSQDELPKYTRDLGYVFLCLKQLEDEKFRIELFKVLKDQSKFNLIVVESNSYEHGTKELYDDFDSVIKSSKNKKIIFITTKDNSFLPQKFTEDADKYEVDNYFSDLTKGTQKEILNKKLIIFQEQKNKINLVELLGIVDLNSYLSEECSKEILNEIINLKVLVELFTKKEIKIGIRPLGKSELEGAYSTFFEDVDTTILIERLEAAKDMFVISGINGKNKIDILMKNLKNLSKKKEIDLKQDQICEFDNDTKNNEDINIILVDDNFDTKDLKKLCSKNPERNFYWIAFHSTKFMLRHLYSYKFLDRAFRYPKNPIIPSDIKTELLKNIDKNVYFFIGIDKKEKLFEILELQGKEFKLPEIIVRKECNEREFKDFANKKLAENKIVYLLEVNNKNLITWRDVTRQPISSEDELIDIIKDKSSIIIDKPGMGKSTTLTVLSEKMLESHWVISVTLRDWQEKINTLTDSDLVNFLISTNNLKTSLERSLAKFFLNKKNVSKPLLLLFDGFDEIRDYEIENKGKRNIEMFLKNLKENTQAIVWITAREHDADRLKNTLSTFDVKFEPLKPDKQKEYFMNFWLCSFSLCYDLKKVEYKFEKYYEELSKAASKIISDEENSFMGIPLTLRLFAEGFRSKFQKFIESDSENCQEDFDNLTIIKLYQYFIDEKFKIFFKQKTNLSSGLNKVSEDWFKDVLTKMHHRLAFHELFGAEETKKLLGTKRPFQGQSLHVNKEELEELLSFGIIRSTKESHYEFLHRSFAERFVSELLANMLKNKQINNSEKYDTLLKFLKKNIFKENNEVIYKFLDAVSKEDQAFSFIWAAINSDENSYLLGTASKIFQYTMVEEKKNEKEKAKSILSNKSIVEHYVSWFDKPSIYFNFKGNTKSFPALQNLCSSCRVADNIEDLKIALDYLKGLYGYSDNDYFSEKHLTAQNIIEIASHYVFELKKQSKLDKQLISDCFSFIWGENAKKTFKQIVNKKFYFNVSNEIFSEINNNLGNTNRDWFRNYENINFIFNVRFLTPEIAKKLSFEPFPVDTKFNEEKRNTYNDLIVPLLSLKYLDNHYPGHYLLDKVDTFELVDRFLAFASSGERYLSYPSLEGLLICIYELLDSHQANFEKCLRTIVGSLILLRNWHFNISYKEGTLILSNNKDYQRILKIRYTEQIVQLLKFKKNNPESFEIKLKDVADCISKSFYEKSRTLKLEPITKDD